MYVRSESKEQQKVKPAKHRDPRSGGVLLVVLVVAAVVLVAGATGLVVARLISGAPGAPQVPVSAQTSQSDQARYEYVPFGSTVANLDEGRMTRYLKVNITLQVGKESSADIRNLIEGDKKAVFQDWLLAYLSDKQLDEVKGGAALTRLRRDIQDGFNKVLSEYGDHQIEGVLFTELNVQ